MPPAHGAMESPQVIGELRHPHKNKGNWNIEGRLSSFKLSQPSRLHPTYLAATTTSVLLHCLGMLRQPIVPTCMGILHGFSSLSLSLCRTMALPGGCRSISSGLPVVHQLRMRKWRSHASHCAALPVHPVPLTAHCKSMPQADASASCGFILLPSRISFTSLNFVWSDFKEASVPAMLQGTHTDC